MTKRERVERAKALQETDRVPLYPILLAAVSALCAAPDPQEAARRLRTVIDRARKGACL